MKIERARLPQYASEDKRFIACEVSFDSMKGWHKFNASSSDVEPQGRELYARLVAGDFGPIKEYAPPAKQDTPRPPGTSQPQNFVDKFVAELESNPEAIARLRALLVGVKK